MDNAIQVAPESTGPRVETSALTNQEGAVVHRQRVALGDPSDESQLAQVISDTPADNAAGVVARIAGTAKVDDAATQGVLLMLIQQVSALAQQTQILAQQVAAAQGTNDALLVSVSQAVQSTTEAVTTLQATTLAMPELIETALSGVQNLAVPQAAFDAVRRVRVYLEATGGLNTPVALSLVGTPTVSMPMVGMPHAASQSASHHLYQSITTTP